MVIAWAALTTMLANPVDELLLAGTFDEPIDWLDDWDLDFKDYRKVLSWHLLRGLEAWSRQVLAVVRTCAVLTPTAALYLVQYGSVTTGRLHGPGQHRSER